MSAHFKYYFSAYEKHNTFTVTLHVCLPCDVLVQDVSLCSWLIVALYVQTPSSWSRHNYKMKSISDYIIISKWHMKNVEQFYMFQHFLSHLSHHAPIILSDGHCNSIFWYVTCLWAKITCSTKRANQKRQDTLVLAALIYTYHRHIRDQAMENESIFLEDEPTCMKCRQIFMDPLVLCCTSCDYSFCKSCLSKFWKLLGSEECPNCQEKRLVSELRTCTKHRLKLTLFCIEELHPLCIRCHQSTIHKNHKVYPLKDGVEDCKVRIILSDCLSSAKIPISVLQNIEFSILDIM